MTLTRERRLGAAIALASTCLTAAGDSRADQCPAPPGAPAVATIDRETRVAYLARAFDREVQDIDLWSWGWGALYGMGAVGQAALLPGTNDAGKRIDLYVGIGSAVFGAVSLTALPLKLTIPLWRERARLIAEGGACAELARAERTLREVEKDQAFANGITGHIGNVLVNVGFALILGVGYHRWPSGALSAGVGIPIGEANAFTQPHHLRDVLERYRAGQLDSPGTPGPPAFAWSIVPVLAPGMTGAGVGLRW